MGRIDASGAAARIVERGAPATAVDVHPATAPTTVLRGVGPAVAARLAAAGIACLRDLLLFFPSRHRHVERIDRPRDELVGRIVSLRVRVEQVRRAFLGGGKSVVHVVFGAAQGTSLCAAFFNQPWLAKSLAAGAERHLEARLQRNGTVFELCDVEWLTAHDEERGSCRVRYREIDGVSKTRLRALIAQALAQTDVRDLLPRLPAGLDAEADGDPRDLLRAMHAPVDVDQHEQARRHFAVLEAVELFRRLQAARRDRMHASAIAVPRRDDPGTPLAALLGFEPTADQRRAIDALHASLASAVPMGTLLMGDVGTGKTAVALAVALSVVGAGAQVAFLAPTELLAEQIAQRLTSRLAERGVRIGCLTGSLPAAERRDLARAVESGAIDVVVGTHALMSEATKFRRLALVIVDEHHRFGVEERRRLMLKGAAPHLLVMTATPIPRTSALALFGDLDALELRMRPRGRPPAPAVFAPRESWPRVQRAILRHVRRGGRVFVVCPRIGERGEKGGALRMFEELRSLARCALVHGRMPAVDRRAATEALRVGDVDVLVGTTVLEVGIDVEDATLMVVIGADRFGLATLHQLRGRVGRGRRRGLCILTGVASARTAAVVATRDGFELAEQDLRLRGAGELCGIRQSGAIDFRALDPLDDYALLRSVRDAVRVEMEVEPCA
ncbi:MAG: helicase-related protein [Planctomycetota bacterium]